MGTTTVGHFIFPIAVLITGFGLLATVIVSSLRVATRNAPTLRSRRFQVYSIFWMFQYVAWIIIISNCILTATMDRLFPYWVNRYSAVTFLLIVLLPLFLLFSGAMSHSDPRQRLKKIVENDLGLPGERIESYSYPQVERRFFLSLLTNLLLAIMLHVAFIGNVIIFNKDAAALSFLFLAQIVGSMAVIALATALYYVFGRSLLELCRTKQNFLSAPPLIDNSLEVILMRKCKHPIASIREAIARFDPVTMTEDEPEVAARPFPRHWFRLGGFYAVFMVGLFCLAVAAPNSQTPRGMLKQTGIIADYTVPGDFVPWNPERYCRRGIREAHENPHKAVEDFSLAIRLNPKKQEYFERRAGVYAALGDLDAAERDWTEVIRLQPNSFSYMDRASFFERTKKDLQAALADYTTAIECAEQEKRQQGYSRCPPQMLYSARGGLYEKLGEPEKAAADRKRAGYPE